MTPKLFEQDSRLISASSMLLVRGVLQVTREVVNVRAKRLKRLELGGGEQYVKGYNYH
ncbi:MAG: hypothetical protein IBJ03_00025 [Gemmatimonadaceae bacterium]|nr:hypothetical protein [Gemmatimonadaceae bacterium]